MKRGDFWTALLHNTKKLPPRLVSRLRQLLSSFNSNPSSRKKRFAPTIFTFVSVSFVLDSRFKLQTPIADFYDDEYESDEEVSVVTDK